MKKLLWIITLMICSNYAQAQISGIIYDEALNEPLKGVSIFTCCITGSQGFVKTETDVDGFFNLRSSCRKGEIMISHPTYANQEIQYKFINDKIDLSLDTIYLSGKSDFSKYENLEISGFVYDEINDPLIGAGIITSCKTDSSGHSSTITDVDGFFNLKSSCKKGKISVSYIGYANQEIEYEIKNDKLQLDTIFFKPGAKKGFGWENKRVEFNSNLTGQWDVVYFRTAKNKKYYLDEKDKGHFYFQFLDENYDSNKYGTFLYYKGLTYDEMVKFRLIKNNKIEFRMEWNLYFEGEDRYDKIIKDSEPNLSSPREKERLEFFYKFKPFSRSFMNGIFEYEIRNNELFMTNGIDEILLRKSS